MGSTTKEQTVKTKDEIREGYANYQTHTLQHVERDTEARIAAGMKAGFTETTPIIQERRRILEAVRSILAER